MRARDAAILLTGSSLPVSLSGTKCWFISAFMNDSLPSFPWLNITVNMEIQYYNLLFLPMKQTH